jgi:hypothetical protein
MTSLRDAGSDAAARRSFVSTSRANLHFKKHAFVHPLAAAFRAEWGPKSHNEQNTDRHRK